MVTRRLDPRGMKGALMILLLGVHGVPAHAQERPDVHVGVRPDRVRVGSEFIMTVRVEATATPDTIEMVPGPAAELLSVRERRSTSLGQGATDRVLERDYTLRALNAGRVSPTTIRVVSGSDTVEAAVPAVTAVDAGLRWARAAPRVRAGNDESAPRDEGRPPRAEGRDASMTGPGGGAPQWYGGGSAAPGGAVSWNPYGVAGVDPWSGAWSQHGNPALSPYGAGTWNPYGSVPQSPYGGSPGLPASPYGSSGWGASPTGSAWAPTARGDPWWPELIPELDRYASVDEDPTGLVSLEAGLTPTRVYEGQQVTLVATATFAPEALGRFGRSPEFFPPSADGAWAVDIPYAPPTPAAAGGRVQEAHTVMRAFFPMAPGSLEVRPSSLVYDLAGTGSGRPSADTLSTTPLTVDVLPVPTSEAPPGWNGAVGRYLIRGWVQPSTVGWGEAALLTVEVSGAGNVRTLRRPNAGAVWGAELRPTGERATVEVRDGVVGGSKTFSWLLVPVEAGRLRIGPIVFSYFDPWIGGFGQVATDEIEVDVGPFPGTGPRSDPRGVAGALETDGGAGGAVEWPGADADAFDSLAAAGPSFPGADAGTAMSTTPDTSDISEAPALQLPSPPRSGEGADPAPELGIRALAQAVSLRPDDAEAWLALGRAYADDGPNEGWAEWALTSGLRHAPRSPSLRRALWGMPDWRGSSVAGLPRLPLSAGESAALGSVLLLVGLTSLATLLRGYRRSRRRLATLGLSGALLLSSLLAFEPWWTLRQPDWGISVEGPVQLRLAPSWASPDVASLESGMPLRLGERFGTWLHVARPDGTASGWVESVQVAPLAPVAVRVSKRVGADVNPEWTAPAPGTPPSRTASPGG